MRVPAQRLFSAILFLGFFLAFGIDAFAQSSSNRANKRYNSAREAYDLKDRNAALLDLEEALQIDQEFYDALMLKSQIFSEAGDWEKGIAPLSRALNIRENERGIWLEQLMRLHFRSGQYQKSLKLLEEGSLLPNGVLKDSLLMASVIFASSSSSNPSDIAPVALLGDVNSSSREYYPTLFSNGTRMIFTRELNVYNRSFGQEDFFEAEKQGDEWVVIRSLNEINTERNEGAPSVRGDGRVLMFAACAGVDGSYGRRAGKGSCDIFQSNYDVIAASYLPAENLKSMNSSSWESQPALSSDGRFLFFVRAFQSRDGRGLVQDIYISEREDTGEWTTPAPLPDVINSEGREENPFLHSDGRSFYFASDGHPGMGGMDLFVSRKNEDGTWSEPENLGYPINTSGDENSLQVFPDGRHAIFATDRSEHGNLDLWRFELPQEVSANEVALWKGEVVDAKTGQVVEAKVQVLDSAGVLISTQRSNPSDGQFTLPFSTNEEVIIQIEHPEFAFFSLTLAQNTDLDQFVSIALDRLEIGTTMTLRDVRFDKSSADLIGSFQPELDQLAKTMLQSLIRIEIIGHTDADGSSSENLLLSEARAEAVALFLAEQGVDRKRMELKGMGATMPIASNETDYGKARNRRTEIVVIN